MRLWVFPIGDSGSKCGSWPNNTAPPIKCPQKNGWNTQTEPTPPIRCPQNIGGPRHKQWIRCCWFRPPTQFLYISEPRVQAWIHQNGNSQNWIDNRNRELPICGFQGPTFNPFFSVASNPLIFLVNSVTKKWYAQSTEGLLMNLLQDPIEAAVLAVLPLLLEPAHQAAPRVRSAALSPILGQSHMETWWDNGNSIIHCDITFIT